MSAGLRELRPSELNAELERVLLPRLTTLLRTRGLGHCMRASDLDTELMLRIGSRLREEVPEAQVYVLSGQASADGITISSSRLVELRNPEADNRLRPPLLVFVPNDLRAAAEDSYASATFEVLTFEDLHAELAANLLNEIPNGMRGAVRELLARLDELRWPFATPLAVARFLLTLRLNNHDRDAAGAALFELGLVPDFELFKELPLIAARVTRNHAAVRHLTWDGATERGRVLGLGLTDRGFRARLAAFVADAGLEDPRAWCRRIVVERDLWGLAFHQWPLKTGPERAGVFIEVVELGLPRTSSDDQDVRLHEVDFGTPYLPLGLKGLKQFPVTLRVNPLPGKVPGLHRFSLQLRPVAGGADGLVRNVKAWRTAQDTRTVPFQRLTKKELEFGWYVLRVVPLTEEGDEIPWLDAQGNPIVQSEDGPRPPYQSEQFLVLPDGEIEDPLEQRAVPREPSLLHALRRLQFSALLDGRDPSTVQVQQSGWTTRERADSAEGRGRSRPRRVTIPGCEVIQVNFGRDGRVHVPVPRRLKTVEQRILAHEGPPVCWRLPVHLGAAGEVSAEPLAWPLLPEADDYLAARARLHARIRSSEAELVCQGLDWRTAKDEVCDAARALERLVERLLSSANQVTHALAGLRAVLALDSVTLDITDHRGRRREAALLGPTHPLRAFWWLLWSALSEQWLQSSRGAEPDQVAAAREALLNRLSPLGFPPILPMGVGGRLLTPIDNLSPFWTLYGLSGEEDPRGLLGDVCAALGLPEPGISAATITGETLAARVERYLIQHPYVQTLQINAFNPGRATVLAEMLLELQRRPAFSDMRYDVRLFVPDPDAPGVGEAMISLLAPTGSVNAREEDAFSNVSRSHLFPKLGLAIRGTAEFTEDSERHAAHVSLLFDVFPTAAVGTIPAGAPTGFASVYGLFQDFRSVYEEDDNAVAWHREPKLSPARPLEGAEGYSPLIGRLPRLLAAASASVATGVVSSDRVPRVTMGLGLPERTLIHQVHEVSDWVITIDRNMGIEFYDHGGRRDRPDYLIDHSPDLTTDFGYKLVVTSRSLQELEAMLGPVLSLYELPADGPHAVALLHQVRSLSGRLALKLLSAPTQRAEVLGLALSRLYLDYQRVFHNQIVVPLDAHLDLYKVLHREVSLVGGDLSFKRTDLALFDLDTQRRHLTCRLVEVKCYGRVGDHEDYALLKASIAAQIEQSEQVLALHFDPHRRTPDRPDRLLKTRELVSLLAFYLERGARYGLMDPPAAEALRACIAGLEEGYTLAFTRSAVIFDFDRAGTDPVERDLGVEFHRIGKDLIRALVDAAAASVEPEARPSVPMRAPTLSDLNLPLPRLRDAAFLAPEAAPGVPPVHETHAEDVAPAPEEVREGGGREVSPGPAMAHVAEGLPERQVAEEVPSGALQQVAVQAPVHADQGVVPAIPTEIGATAPSQPPSQVEPLSAQPTPELTAHMERTARQLNRALSDYNIGAWPIEVTQAQVGPSVIRFQVKLKPGERLSRLQAVAEDIARSVEASRVPIIDNVLGTSFVSIDLPNPKKRPVPIQPALEHLRHQAEGELPFLIGVNPAGEPRTLDLARLPHLLVAGTSGSGKTVFLYGLILSLTARRGPERLRLLLIDPKQTDFTFFEGLPHLETGHVVLDPEEAVGHLRRLLDDELPRRTEILRAARARDIIDYNQRSPQPMPPMVVIIDEFADLMDVLNKRDRDDFEQQVNRMAQRTRNVGIHLVIATQRPDVKVVTGRLKSNLHCRISFALPSAVDSKTILDVSGAERLLGRGDLLLRYEDRLERLQGYLVEVSDVAHLR